MRVHKSLFASVQQFECQYENTITDSNFKPDVLVLVCNAGADLGAGTIKPHGDRHITYYTSQPTHVQMPRAVRDIVRTSNEVHIRSENPCSDSEPA